MTSRGVARCRERRFYYSPMSEGRSKQLHAAVVSMHSPSTLYRIFRKVKMTFPDGTSTIIVVYVIVNGGGGMRAPSNCPLC